MDLSSLPSDVKDIIFEFFQRYSLVSLLILERTCRKYRRRYDENYWQDQLEDYRRHPSLGRREWRGYEFAASYDYYTKFTSNVRTNLTKLRIHLLKEEICERFINKEKKCKDRQLLKEQMKRILIQFPNDSLVIELKELKAYRRERLCALNEQRQFIQQKWPTYAGFMNINSFKKLKIKDLPPRTIIQWIDDEDKLILIKLSNGEFKEIKDLKVYLEALKKRHRMSDQRIKDLYKMK